MSGSSPPPLTPNHSRTILGSSIKLWNGELQVEIMRRILATTALAILLSHSRLALTQSDPVHRDWKAAWITHPTVPLRDPIVLHFRRTLDLPSVPDLSLIHI